MNREEVLEVYRKGDANKRLSLFLGYRDLREEFSLIEQESEHDDFVSYLGNLSRCKKRMDYFKY